MGVAKIGRTRWLPYDRYRVFSTLDMAESKWLADGAHLVATSVGNQLDVLSR